MVHKNKMVTLKNLILKYISMKNINILKRKCRVGINLLFLELILKLYDVCFTKNICIAPFWPSHKMLLFRPSEPDDLRIFILDSNFKTSLSLVLTYYYKVVQNGVRVEDLCHEASYAKKRSHSIILLYVHRRILYLNFQ